MSVDASENIDKFDRAILKYLQQDATISMNDLGKKVGLSHTPCWRRIKRLEDEGYIQKRVTLLSAKALALDVNVHVYLTMKKHDEASLNSFESAVQDVPEIVECYSITGERDYMIRIAAKDVEAYERFMKTTLVHLPNVASVNSVFALKQVKYTTALPI